MPIPRRTEDWELATRLGVIATLCVVFATFAYAGAADAPLSLNDLAVLIAIVVQTVTIGYFAGSHSNRIRNLEKQREEDVSRCRDIHNEVSQRLREKDDR